MSARPSKQFQAVCVERYNHQLHKDLKSPGAFKSLKAIFQQNAIWKKGSKGTITVTFGSNKCSGCDVDSAWSMIGSESSNSNPSMNLGFIDAPFSDFSYNGKTYPFKDFKDATRNWCSDQRNDCDPSWQPGTTILHEFGHSMGMLHEHQNNLFASNTIKLDKNAVISYYNRIGLGQEGAYTNMLEIYDCSKNKGLCDYDGSKFDPDSIMLYHLPDEFVIGKNPTKGNFKYSKLDKEWLAKKYPMSITASEQPMITVKFIDKSENPWKQAWTTKTVTEFLCPIIGVRFRFAWSDGTSIDYRPIEVPVPSIKIKTVTPATPAIPAIPDKCKDCPNTSTTSAVVPVKRTLTPSTHMLADMESETQEVPEVEAPVSMDIDNTNSMSETPVVSGSVVGASTPSTLDTTEVKEAFSQHAFFGHINVTNYMPLYICLFFFFFLFVVFGLYKMRHA